MWRPIHIDHILNSYNPLEARVLGIIIGWVLIIATVIGVSVYNLPEDWIRVDGDKTQLIRLFLLNPAMLIGLLLLFWFGFEWSFIPVFLSMFIVGLFSNLEPHWAMLFGLSFVFGLAIYAIVYHCVNVSYNLDSLGSLLLFIGVSFVASTASSLGTFIWSLSHDLTAAQTATLWNGWWAGTFLQSLVLAGPILFSLSGTVERFKNRYFQIPEKPEVSTKWIYSTVLLVTIVISVFIISGDYLGKQRIAEYMTSVSDVSKQTILSSLESFEIITWVSVWIILCVGLGAVFLIGSWNSELKKKVAERTISLEEAEQKLKKSLSEKETLLKEIHHRVKNNLAVVTAMLDLQLMRTDCDTTKHMLGDSKARVKSMAFVHETLYQTENFSSIDMKSYIERLVKSIRGTFNSANKDIEISVLTNGKGLEMEKAIPLGLLLNELIVNAYKHAFKGLEKGKIFISVEVSDSGLEVVVQDNGVGFEKGKDLNSKANSLGMTLIKTLARQLKTSIELQSEPGNTRFCLSTYTDESSEVAA